MTRLTDEQIDKVVRDVREEFGDSDWFRRVAHRIAALAVQEVEREVPLETRTRWAKEFNALAAENATLTAQLAERDASSKANEGSLIRAIEHERSRAERAEAQLAEAQESLLAAHKQLRSFGVEPKPPLGFAPNGHAGSRSWFEAALAEVTKERDFYRLDAERYAQFAHSYRAQLSSDKREALVPCRECAGSGLVPATPKGDDCGWCERNGGHGACKCATPSGELCDADCGCKAPEAREVPFPARFLVLDHDGKCIGYVPMGCTEARQVVAMAQEAE